MTNIIETLHSTENELLNHELDFVFGEAHEWECHTPDYDNGFDDLGHGYINDPLRVYNE